MSSWHDTCWVHGAVLLLVYVWTGLALKPVDTLAILLINDNDNHMPMPCQCFKHPDRWVCHARQTLKGGISAHSFPCGLCGWYLHSVRDILDQECFLVLLPSVSSNILGSLEQLYVHISKWKPILDCCCVLHRMALCFPGLISWSNGAKKVCTFKSVQA